MNKATWLFAGLTGISTAVLTWVLFSNESIGDLPFGFGHMSPWLSEGVGIVSGILIGRIS